MVWLVCLVLVGFVGDLAVFGFGGGFVGLLILGCWFWVATLILQLLVCDLWFG